MAANKQALTAFTETWDDEDPDDAVFDAYHALCQTDQSWANTLVMTLGEALEAWAPLMRKDLYSLPCNSVVGARCLQIMMRAEGLIERLHDIDGDSIREQVLKQCNVYFFG